MATRYGFHPEALLEYAEATNYYLREASRRVADGFVTAVESAVVISLRRLLLFKRAASLQAARDAFQSFSG